MQYNTIARWVAPSVLAMAGSFTVALLLTAALAQTGQRATGAATCSENTTGITLPRGFCATVFADKHRPRRAISSWHLTALSMSTPGAASIIKNDTPPPGGFLVALKDTKGDGHADVIERFGETMAKAAMAAPASDLQGRIFAEINDRIVRYQLKPGEIVPKAGARRPSCPACR